MNQFTEKYKTLSTTALVKIVDNPNDYQALAVEAAKNELAVRPISKEELANAKAENEIEIKEKQAKNEKRLAFENKVKEISSSLIDTIHPVQQSTPTTNRIIAMLCIVLALTYLIDVFRDFRYIKFMLTYSQAKWGVEMRSICYHFLCCQ